MIRKALSTLTLASFAAWVILGVTGTARAQVNPTGAGETDQTAPPVDQDQTDGGTAAGNNGQNSAEGPPPPSGAPPPGSEPDDTTKVKEPSLPKPFLDPFLALIQPKAPATPVPILSPKSNAAPPPPPPKPPVSFNVVAIAGEEPNFVAVIDYKGQTYIVQPGTKVPDDKNPEFEVKAVNDEKVEVYDPAVQRIVRRHLPSPNQGSAGGEGGGEGGGGGF